MSPGDDRKMFAPLRRGEAISPESKLVEILKLHSSGATAASLAADLLRSGAVLGTKPRVTARVEQLLDELEQAARMERIPDGRYRVTRIRS